MAQIEASTRRRQVAAWVLAVAALAGSSIGLALWKSPEWAISNARWAGPAWFATVPTGIAALLAAWRRPRVVVAAYVGAFALVLFAGEWAVYFLRQLGAR
jgi:hypothetical protein